MRAPESCAAYPACTTHISCAGRAENVHCTCCGTSSHTHKREVLEVNISPEPQIPTSPASDVLAWNGAWNQRGNNISTFASPKDAHKQQKKNGYSNGNSPSIKWEKVLWKAQNFPDNYTDHTFLQELVINADVPKRDYWRVALGSAAVTQQLCTVVAAVATPVHLRRGTFGPHEVLAVCALLLLAGYGVCGAIGGHVLGGSLGRGLRQCALLTGGVFLLSPLYRSLMRTISEDSIIALTVMLLVVHLYLHDYNFVNTVTDKLIGAVSLGAAVFASVLIASGLPSETDVFVHVLLSLELYLLSPFMRRYIRQASVAAHVAITASMFCISTLLLLPLSPNLTIVFTFAVVFISFLSPRWLVRIHKFKAKINGPWDEAVPVIPSSIHETGPFAKPCRSLQ